MHEEAGRALLHAPLWSTSSLAPFLPFEDQAAIAAGDASWVIALGPLVPDLDTAARVAVVGGDTVWELEGAERELLATNDETRPLGVVSGGEATARSPRRTSCPRCARGRRSSRSKRSASARVRSSWGSRTSPSESSSVAASARTRPSRIRSRAARRPRAARSLAWSAAWCVAVDDTEAPVAAAAAKADAADAAVLVCERAIQAHGGIGFTWEHVLHRLYKRALGIQAWEASSSQLRAEVADHLLDTALEPTAKRAPLGMCLAGGEGQAVRIRFCGFSLRGRRSVCRA